MSVPQIYRTTHQTNRLSNGYILRPKKFGTHRRPRPDYTKIAKGHARTRRDGAPVNYERPASWQGRSKYAPPTTTLRKTRQRARLRRLKRVS